MELLKALKAKQILEDIEKKKKLLNEVGNKTFKIKGYCKDYENKECLQFTITETNYIDNIIACICDDISYQIKTLELDLENL